MRPRLADQEFHDLDDERERCNPRGIVCIPTPDLSTSGTVIRRALVTVSGIADVFRDPYLKPDQKGSLRNVTLERLPVARFNQAESRKKDYKSPFLYMSK